MPWFPRDWKQYWWHMFGIANHLRFFLPKSNFFRNFIIVFRCKLEWCTSNVTLNPHTQTFKANRCKRRSWTKSAWISLFPENIFHQRKTGKKFHVYFFFTYNSVRVKNTLFFLNSNSFQLYTKSISKGWFT